MTNATMSPHITKLLDEILSRFSVDEPVSPRRSRSKVATRHDDAADATNCDSKSPPSPMFVKSVRKRAKVS